MIGAEIVEQIRLKYEAFMPYLNEQTRRVWSAIEARSFATTVEQFQQQHRPVISIDTKKKALVGNFHNQGQAWEPQGEPTEVNVHNFPDKTLGQGIPYGIYDLTQNQGWVNVGIDHDTAQFAVESSRPWWLEMGQQL